jgi:NAD(P)H dehydrogenase (quinone)
MNVLIVYAHHEPTSFTSAMKNLAIEVLDRQGHSVAVSDLYGQGFNPVAQKWDFVTTTGGHFNYMLEQKHAARLDLAFSPDIVGEIQKVQAAEVILFVAPLWWLGVPAILHGWFDRVMAMGVAWDGGRNFEKGLLRGKQSMMILAGGGPAEYFKKDGAYQAGVDEILQPINRGVLAYSGLDVHEPYVALNVLGVTDAGRENLLKDLQTRLEHLVDKPQWLYHLS